MKFTQKNIDTFKMPKGKKEHLEKCDTVRRLYLHVRKGVNGESRAFIYQYKFGSEQSRMSLGTTAEITCAQALETAEAMAGQIARAKNGLGKHPAQERDERNAAKAPKTKADVLGVLIAAYLADKVTTMRPNTYKNAKYNLNTLLAPLHDYEKDSDKLYEAIVPQLDKLTNKHGLVSANRARASLSAVFRWAINKRMCRTNPVTGTVKQDENKDGKQGIKNRPLTDSEAAAVWKETEAENDFSRCLRLILLTGCRRDEIGDLRWSEIDLESRTITLPAARCKNGRAMLKSGIKEFIVPLCDAAVAILKEIPVRANRDLVFGLGNGGFSGWSKPKKALNDIVKFKPAWTIHGLRVTVRTGISKLGVQNDIGEAAVNHLAPKLVRTYNKNTYETEKRAALELWASHLFVAIAQANGANVTLLRKA